MKNITKKLPNEDVLGQTFQTLCYPYERIKQRTLFIEIIFEKEQQTYIFCKTVQLIISISGNINTNNIIC